MDFNIQQRNSIRGLIKTYIPTFIKGYNSNNINVIEETISNFIKDEEKLI